MGLFRMAIPGVGVILVGNFLSRSFHVTDDRSFFVGVFEILFRCVNNTQKQPRF